MNQTARARWVVPVVGPPIENGFIELLDNRIVRVGRGHPGSPFADLGDVAVMPGWVNAHTHLEFSDLARPIGNPGVELADWIGQVVTTRQNATGRLAPAESISIGLDECGGSATVLIGEIATTPYPGDCGLLPERIAFAEVLGLSTQRSDDRLARAEEHLRGPRSDSPRPKPQDRGTQDRGISPHAPYSTPLEVITECVTIANRFGCTVAMHVAESPAERQLLETGTGRFATRLAEMGLDVAANFPWPVHNPVTALIDELARAPAAILIHGNDLRPNEIARIARHDHLSVVYCPRTHAFFGHARHPVAELLSAGVNVGIGTDSRASNPDLRLDREVQFLLNHRQDLHPSVVIEMATLGGAIALRRRADYGSLEPGRMARFAIVPTTAHDVDGLYSDLSEVDSSPGCPETLHNWTAS